MRFSELAWQSRFVDQFPGDPETRNFTRPVRGALYSRVEPTAVREPRLLGWSDALAAELGIIRPDAGSDRESLELLAGNRTLPAMRSYAARYGGHQFGNWAGQLGDGRAITLGEAPRPDGARLEFQLKGAGPTPYSRRADGRAVLRSSLREFLCSEAMHFLGVPTTRALSLVATGEEVVRDLFYDGNPKAEPGAIVCRVAPSFLRFGNFEILAEQGETELLRRLADSLIESHYPEIDAQDPDAYGLMLDDLARRTARMVAHWMRVGFVHGVINTDNMSALGLTIDYGPYGWLEPYDPGWTPNTTDAQGRRYRYGNQPGIALWNLARLCEAFLPLGQPSPAGRAPLDEPRMQAVLTEYRREFESAYSRMLASKLGVDSIRAPEDQAWVEEMFELMEMSRADLTIFFRGLADWDPRTDFLATLSHSLYTPASPELASRWQAWSAVYAARFQSDALSPEMRVRRMRLSSPKYVPRNYLAQTAIRAAESGDLAPLERLMRVLQTPYDEHPADSELAAKRPAWAENSPGCSALSCSS